MTMPHLMNCPHEENGWCLTCVAEQHEKTIRLVVAMRTIKSSLMHQRRFGVETLSAWRSVAVDAEGSIEDAILPDNAI